MDSKKTLIVCISTHHGNTMKVAKIMGNVLNADIIEPEHLDVSILDHYDLVGFGSGVYDGKHHKSLFELISKISLQSHKKAFLFSTSTIPFKGSDTPIKQALNGKWFEVIGSFQCKGFMDYSFTKYFFGWFNKWRPNEKDLNKAEEFAKTLVF